MMVRTSLAVFSSNVGLLMIAWRTCGGLVVASGVVVAVWGCAFIAREEVVVAVVMIMMMMMMMMVDG